MELAVVGRREKTKRGEWKCLAGSGVFFNVNLTLHPQLLGVIQRGPFLVLFTMLDC